MTSLLITLYSLINGIDTSLAFQIARVESGMNPEAISKTGDYGLFQLNRRVYKFHNKLWSFDPNINTAIALNTIQILKKTCKFKTDNGFVICYNLGRYGASKIKNPHKQTYWRKMNLLWSNG